MASRGHRRRVEQARQAIENNASRDYSSTRRNVRQLADTDVARRASIKLYGPAQLREAVKSVPEVGRSLATIQRYTPAYDASVRINKTPVRALPNRVKALGLIKPIASPVRAVATPKSLSKLQNKKPSQMLNKPARSLPERDVTKHSDAWKDACKKRPDHRSGRGGGKSKRFVPWC